MEEVTRQFVQLGASWIERLHCLLMQVGRRFGRREIQEYVLEYLIGLLRLLERKNGWQLAQASEHPTPNNMQYFRARAQWDMRWMVEECFEAAKGEVGLDPGLLTSF